MTSVNAVAAEHHPDTRARPVVEVRGLEKRYGSSTAVRGISFSVRQGELFGLLGSNGAGKTTTVEILQGLRPADGGSVTVLGLDPQFAGDRLRRLVGAQLQDAALPERIRVGEALGLFASLHPSPGPSTSWPTSGSSRTCGAGRSARCPAGNANGSSWRWPWSGGPSWCSSTSSPRTSIP